MPGERQRIYLLDTTLFDCFGSAGAEPRRLQQTELIQALGNLGIDYIACRNGASAGRTRGRSGVRGRGTGETATTVCTWQPDPDQRAPQTTVGSDALHNRCGLADAGALLLTIDAVDRQDRVSETMGAFAEIADVAATGREAIVEVARYFEACRTDPIRSSALLTEALAAGARWVVLADSRGTSTPDEVASAVQGAGTCVPAGHLGIMASNALGRGVANTLAALRAGCRLAAGTLTGLGRAGGHASLATLVPTLLLNSELAGRFVTRVTAERLAGISHAIRILDGALEHASEPEKAPRGPPFAGGAAVCGSSPAVGIASAAPYATPPALDRAGLMSRLAAYGIAPPGCEAEIDRLIETIGARDRLGYGLAEADASFELVVRRALGHVPRYFSVVDFQVGLARRRDARGRLVRTSDAEVVLKLGGSDTIVRAAGGGKGPVDALDQALRCNLGRFQSLIHDVELGDYMVRILRRGGQAATRVTVENRSRLTGARWLTVGVAPSIVDASLEALVDGLTFCLFKAGARV